MLTNLSPDDFEIRKTTSKINSGQDNFWPDADITANCEADVNIPSNKCNGLAGIPDRVTFELRESGQPGLDLDQT